jgi:hypothetical protein
MARVKRMLNPLRTQIRVVRFGTPPDFEDGLVEVRNRRLGSVILSYHQLVALARVYILGIHPCRMGAGSLDQLVVSALLF